MWSIFPLFPMDGSILWCTTLISLLILTLTSASYLKAFPSICLQKVKTFKVGRNIKQLTYVHLKQISLCLMWHCYSLSFCIKTGPSHTHTHTEWLWLISSVFIQLVFSEIQGIKIASISFCNTLFSSGLQKCTLVTFLIPILFF